MDIPREKLRPDDVIIALMGPTGAGKSNFIDVLNQQIGRRTGYRLVSYTSEVQTTTLEGYNGDKRVILVDAPGFDDTNRSDMQVLDMISQWLEKTYRKKIKLSGILYMHRISDNRVGGSPLRNIRMFGELCGDSAMSRVVLVTTMWDKMADPLKAEMREQELKDTFWAKMLERGSRTARFLNTLDSAREIINGLILKEIVDGGLVLTNAKRETLLLQEELVDLKKRLNETHAGRMLYATLQQLLDEQKETIEKLLAQVDERNPQVTAALQKERERIEEALQRTLDDVQRLKIPMTRRIALFFFRKRGKINQRRHDPGLTRSGPLDAGSDHLDVRSDHLDAWSDHFDAGSDLTLIDWSHKRRG